MTDNPDVKEDPQPSSFDRLYEFFRTRFLSVVLVAVLATFVFITFGPTVKSPRWVKLAVLTFVGTAPYGYMFGQYVTSLLYDPQHIYLVDLDARHLDGALYQFPSSEFRDLEVRAGDLTRLTPHLYAGKQVDVDDMAATGNWRGTLDDRELLRALSAVVECRDMLEADAKRGFAIETQAFSIVRNATRAATLRVINTFEDGALPDQGDGLNTAVDEAISEYDLESRVDRLTETDKMDSAEIQEVEPNEFDPESDISTPDPEDVLESVDEVAADD